MLRQLADLRFLGAGTLLNSVGMMGEVVVLGWLALELTDSPFLVGAAMGARALPLFFVGVPAGVIAAGALMLIFAVGLAGMAPGAEAVPVILGLFLNGVGWNLAFVAGSALLTDALAPVERASVQGFADLLMGLMGAVGSAAGGMILGLWGFAILNAVGAALVLGPLAATWLRRPVLKPVA